MPNIKSATKRMELSRRAQEKNRAVRSRLRRAVRRVREAEGAEEAAPLFRDAVTLLDRAAQRHIMHPRKAARLKSLLARRVNSLES